MKIPQFLVWILACVIFALAGVGVLGIMAPEQAQKARHAILQQFLSSAASSSAAGNTLEETQKVDEGNLNPSKEIEKQKATAIEVERKIIEQSRIINDLIKAKLSDPQSFIDPLATIEIERRKIIQIDFSKMGLKPSQQLAAEARAKQIDETSHSIFEYANYVFDVQELIESGTCSDPSFQSDPRSCYEKLYEYGNALSITQLTEKMSGYMDGPANTKLRKVASELIVSIAQLLIIAKSMALVLPAFPDILEIKTDSQRSDE